MFENINLSERMKTVADLVTDGYSVADVGCDHAYVSIYLALKKHAPHCVAMDVRKGPLSKAAENVASYGLEEKIDLRLSDGLDKLKAGETDAVVIAGMGGPLMLSILFKEPQKAFAFKELILQPQSEICEFRRTLRERGFKIVDEKAVFEDGKYYFPMKAVYVGAAGECEDEKSLRENNYNQYLADCFGGILMERNDEVLKAFLNKEKEKKESILETLLKQESTSDAYEDNARRTDRINSVKEEITDIAFVLENYK